ncbi:protein TBATA isoform X1 [Pygocentrus nattereri]|uniref:Thymus, brain and testes associated n=2 Tax=Pygocentrus nattereri TaxID=42514 RepID=A0A3B4BPG8_PYGNA|nr:protein TBATA isoform X1 [Pygocentrus nattereri]
MQIMESCEEARELQSCSHSNPEKTPFENPAQLISDLARVTTRGSARFGTLSHHSFFSRHNPHPHRVTHISGLNGSPVCTVNDDWYSNTPLCPHPLIKSQALASGNRTQPLSYSTASGVKHGAALLSEAWQEELKDLATKISLSAPSSSRRGEGESSREEEPPRRKTQYSAQTGRIIPPSSWGAKRRDTPATHRRTATHRPQTTSLGGQELRVLELLCQILQTDSLSLVQQWLLLAGDREKELVLGLLQQAMTDSPNLNQLPFTAQTEPPLNPPTGLTRRKRRLKSLSSAQEALDDIPELIGEAEVLQVRPEEAENISEDSGLHREHSR